MVTLKTILSRQNLWIALILEVNHHASQLLSPFDRCVYSSPLASMVNHLSSDIRSHSPKKPATWSLRLANVKIVSPPRYPIFPFYYVGLFKTGINCHRRLVGLDRKGKHQSVRLSKKTRARWPDELRPFRTLYLTMLTTEITGGKLCKYRWTS